MAQCVMRNLTNLVNKIDQILDKIAPVKEVRISAKRRFTEPWMTHGLEQSSHKKMRLYKKNSDHELYTSRPNQIQGIQKHL